MTQERQKAAVTDDRDRQADEIAQSFARFSPQEDRRSWLGAAALTAVIGVSVAGAAFVLTGETPFSRPGEPEMRVVAVPHRDGPPSDLVIWGMPEAALASRPPTRSAPPAPNLASVAPAAPASPPVRPTSDAEPVAETPPVIVPVVIGAPALVPPPRPELRKMAIAEPAPRRPRPRPTDAAALVAVAEPSTPPQNIVFTSLRPRLRPADMVARATSAMGSLVPARLATPRTSFDTGPVCSARLAAGIPNRPRGAAPGGALARKMDGLQGAERDRLIERELLAGNLPGFLRMLTPVTIRGRLPSGRVGEVTICVTPDYLALGSDSDYLRVPMGLPAAARVADRFGFLLPTTRMVDAIFAQARLRLAPQPMTPGAAMTSTRYFWQHNRTVDGQTRGRAGQLTAGQKKDLVLTNRLRRNPGRVAIYGWHKPDGQPIQPLSTVHGARYADYSHGVRLVSQTAYVGGRAVALADLLADPTYAGILSGEGPIEAPARLMASLYR
ncbi:hypothetical protein EV662_11849 [Rhodovulum marinum]|uniref:Uncharacterized protein n=2 Tax=Rhodovulum marinum TaxID=320662 RepID=A0A4R2PUK2_9RHOB|nr:hypothetical protein EV662_11849 [Rhodovulum marinum]